MATDVHYINKVMNYLQQEKYTFISKSENVSNFAQREVLNSFCIYAKGNIKRATTSENFVGFQGVFKMERN